MFSVNSVVQKDFNLGRGTEVLTRHHLYYKRYNRRNGGKGNNAEAKSDRKPHMLSGHEGKKTADETNEINNSKAHNPLPARDRFNSFRIGRHYGMR